MQNEQINNLKSKNQRAVASEHLETADFNPLFAADFKQSAVGTVHICYEPNLRFSPVVIVFFNGLKSVVIILTEATPLYNILKVFTMCQFKFDIILI